MPLSLSRNSVCYLRRINIRVRSNDVIFSISLHFPLLQIYKLWLTVKLYKQFFFKNLVWHAYMYYVMWLWFYFSYLHIEHLLVRVPKQETNHIFISYLFQVWNTFEIYNGVSKQKSKELLPRSNKDKHHILCIRYNSIIISTKMKICQSEDFIIRWVRYIVRCVI